MASQKAMDKLHRRESQDRVSKKIVILKGEKVPQKQAVAEALSMERAGRIREDGSYIRARKKAKIKK